MDDFLDAIGRGIGGLVGGAIDVIVGIVGSIYGWLNVFLPGPILPVVLGGPRVRRRHVVPVQANVTASAAGLTG